MNNHHKALRGLTGQQMITLSQQDRHGRHNNDCIWVSYNSRYIGYFKLNAEEWRYHGALHPSSPEELRGVSSALDDTNKSHNYLLEQDDTKIITLSDFNGPGWKTLKLIDVFYGYGRIGWFKLEENNSFKFHQCLGSLYSGALMAAANALEKFNVDYHEQSL